MTFKYQISIKKFNRNNCVHNNALEFNQTTRNLIEVLRKKNHAKFHLHTKC